jgi:hypothetical protein
VWRRRGAAAYQRSPAPLVPSPQSAALDENVAAEVNRCVAQHLIDRFALVFTHDVLLRFEV